MFSPKSHIQTMSCSTWYLLRVLATVSDMIYKGMFYTVISVDAHALLTKLVDDVMGRT